MTINFPGYKKLPGEGAYWKPEERGEILLLVSQCTIPMWTEVLNSMQSIVNDLPREPSTGIEIQVFNTTNRKGLLTLDEELLETIADKKEEPGKDYIRVSRGLLKHGTVQDSLEVYQARDRGWYNEFFTDQMVDIYGEATNWHMSILYDGSLPPRDELGILLKNHTRVSATLLLNAHNQPYPQDELSGVIDSLTRITSEEYGALPSSTEEVVTEIARSISNIVGEFSGRTPERDIGVLLN